MTILFRLKRKIFVTVLRPAIGNLLRLASVSPYKIVFDNFKGNNYGDNPKYIAEELLARDLGWDIVWLVNNMNEALPQGVRAVRYNSMQAVYELSTAHVWVDNIRNSYFPPKKKKQIFLQTWHAPFTPKLIEKDAESKLSPAYVKLAKYNASLTNAIISNSRLLTEQYQRAFWLPSDTEILEIGLPRNDLLVSNVNNDALKSILRNKLKIQEEAFVILYAPTFRDDLKLDAYKMDYNTVLRAFKQKMNKEPILLFRLHPNVRTHSKEIVEFSEQIIDVSDYPDIQELSLISDCVISDYSTSPMDFVILKKPAFLYCPDIEKYKKKRGLLPEFNEFPFPKAYDFDELLDVIRNFNAEDYFQTVNKYFQDKPIFDEGSASRQAVDWIVKETAH